MEARGFLPRFEDVEVQSFRLVPAISMHDGLLQSRECSGETSNLFVRFGI